MLHDLTKEAFSVPAAAKLIAATLAEAAETKSARTDSSFSVYTIDRAYPRWREELSSGRGNSKHATFPATSDGDRLLGLAVYAPL